jgi:hypothetical protein
MNCTLRVQGLAAMLCTLTALACSSSKRQTDGNDGAAGSSDGTAGSSDGASNADTAADCTTEIAPGYPKLGVGACGSHVIYHHLQGYDTEAHSARGIIDIGNEVGQIWITRDGPEVRLTMPLREAAYTVVDCIDGKIDDSFTSYEYDANATRLKVGVSRQDDAIYGDFSGAFCAYQGFTNVGGSVSSNYRCTNYSGTFAAYVEPPSCSEDCTGDVTIDGPSCVLPSCTAMGECGMTKCPSNSTTCQAALPVPNGTYSGSFGATFPMLEVAFDDGKLASVRLEAMLGATTAYQVTYDTPKELTRTGGRYDINEELAAADGSLAVLKSGVIEQASAAGPVLIGRNFSFKPEDGDYVTRTSEFELPKVQ